MSNVTSVDAFRAGLSPEQLAVIDQLRAAAMASADNVVEHIKWNAPSYSVLGDDRITLGINKTGSVRAILHRGAKVKNNDDFQFEAPRALVKWADRDRGIMEFESPQAIKAWGGEIENVFKRWMEVAA